MRTISLPLMLVCLLMGLAYPLAAQESQISAKNRFTLQSYYSDAEHLPDWSADLIWKPELFGEYFLSPQFRISADVIMDNRLKMVFDGDNSSQKLDFKIYRAWAAASYHNTEIKGGLQHIRMGTAQILRPLMWFDSLVPGAFLEETEGVKALTLSHYFPNPELRFWLMQGTGKTKGAELVPSLKGSWEFGGRMGVLSPLGETGLSYHQRKVGFPYLNEDINEYRLGLDQRVDGFMGGWLEASASMLDKVIMIPEKDYLYPAPKYSLAATLGGDYTFAIGSGLYLLMEHNVQFQSYDDVEFKDPKVQGALLMSYPLGLLDGLQLLAGYDYKEQRYTGMLSWRRTYDLLSWDLSLGIDSFYLDQGSRFPALSLTINYDL